MNKMLSDKFFSIHIARSAIAGTFVVWALLSVANVNAQTIDAPSEMMAVEAGANQQLSRVNRVDDATGFNRKPMTQPAADDAETTQNTKADIKLVKLIWGDTVYGFAKAQWPVAYCIQEMNKLDSEFRIYEGRRLKVPNMVRGKKLDLSLYCPDYAASRKTNVVKARVTVSDYIKKAEVAHKKRETELAEQARLADLANKQSKIEAAAAKAEAQRLSKLLAEKEEADKAAKIKVAEEKEAQLARQAQAAQLAAEQAAAQQLAAITFKLDSSLTLKENLEDWMDRAQGQLIWRATSDVEVTLDRVIASDLVTALEFISVRLHDYKLEFFAKNTTLVVTEK